MNKKTIIGYFIGPIGAGLLGLISLPIMTWFFPVEEIGKISMLQVVSSLFILIFCLGLDQAYVREYHEEKKKELLFKITFLPGLLISNTLLIIIYNLNPKIISFWMYGEYSQYLSIITIICFELALFLRFLSLVVRMQERSFEYSLSQILPKVSFLLFLLVVVWLGFSKDIYNLILAYLLSMSIACIFFMWNCKKELIILFSLEWYPDKLKKILVFGLPLVLAGLSVWGLNVMDRLFLRSLSTFSELGLYSVTLSIVGVVSILAGVFNTIWSPLVYKWVSQNDVDIQKINNISDHLLAAVFYIVVFTGLFSWILPYLLPIEYNMIQYIIVPSLLGPLFYTLSETTAVGIAVVKKTKLSMFVSIIATLCNFLGNYLLVPKYGAEGASISTAISFWVFYILRTELARRVWIDIDRKKVYCVITLLLIISILHVLAIFNVYFVWFILFLFGLMIFKTSIVQLYKIVVKCVE